MSLDIPPEAEAILDKYPLGDFFRNGQLDRELGERAMSEMMSVLRLDDDRPKPLANTDIVQTYTYSHEVEVVERKPGRVESRDFITFVTNGVDLETRFSDFIGVALACLSQAERRTAPVSKDLKRNPDTKPDVVKQMRHYLGFMKAKQPITHEIFESRQERLGAPLHPTDGLRAVVAIPVAGHQEYKNIYRSLQQFANQDMDPQEYEIVLGINMPIEQEIGGRNNKAAETAKALEPTFAEVRRFQADNPQVPVRFYGQAYHGNVPRIGRIRSDLWGTIAYDMQQRGLDHDVVVLSADADIIHPNRNYLSSMAETFEQTSADIVTAKLVWQMASELPYDAPVNRFLRYQTFLDDIRDRSSEALMTADANTGISLATYAAVGGYDRSAKLGEMGDLVWRILSNRTGGSLNIGDIEAKAPNARLKSHSRRLILAMALGHSPYNAWDQSLIEFGGNDSLRTNEMPSVQANEQVQLHWRTWMNDETPYYTQNLEPAKAERLLAAARKILGFADFQPWSETERTETSYQLSLH